MQAAQVEFDKELKLKTNVPAGSDRTPTPTIALTRLKTSFGMEAPSGLLMATVEQG